jgi:periplasmic protein TonB
VDAVGNILAERRRERLPWAPASILAAMLHAAVLVAFLLSALAQPIRYAAPRAVAVRLLPAGAIRTSAPLQAPPQDSPPPAAPKPKIEKPPPEEPPKPSKNALLLPAKEDKKKKPTPPPVSRPGPAVSPNVSLPSSGEEATGPASSTAPGAGGTAGIGSLKLDQADFKYPVYIERMVQIISLNWFRPAQAVQTNPIVHFQIERDGTITDPRIVTSSGLPFVDRAALRAVLASSPLPPLPAEYGGPHLGIQVVFE